MATPCSQWILERVLLRRDLRRVSEFIAGTTSGAIRVACLDQRSSLAQPQREVQTLEARQRSRAPVHVGCAAVDPPAQEARYHGNGDDYDDCRRDEVHELQAVVPKIERVVLRRHPPFIPA
jgi:hypothetical protein